MSTTVPDDWDNADVSSDFQPRTPPRNLVGISKRGEKVKDDWDADEDDAEHAINVKMNKPLVQRDEWPSLSESKIVPKSREIIKPRAIVQNAAPSLPPELFEPQMRILKRPKGSGTQNSTSSAAKSEKETLQEREEKYKLARERIFGTPSPAPASPSPPRVGSPGVIKVGNSDGAPDGRGSKSSSRPIREPLGPGSQTAFARKTGPGRGQIQLQTKPDRPSSDGP